jgi:hypothetical protein
MLSALPFWSRVTVPDAPNARPPIRNQSSRCLPRIFQVAANEASHPGSSVKRPRIGSRSVPYTKRPPSVAPRLPCKLIVSLTR